jgi:hypothetical protein
MIPPRITAFDEVPVAAPRGRRRGPGLQQGAGRHRGTSDPPIGVMWRFAAHAMIRLRAGSPTRVRTR